MNTSHPSERVTLPSFVKGGGPYVCLTAYTAPIARLLDPHVDLLLVGDSLGMVVYGFPDTLSVTLEMMRAHGEAVVRSTQHALIVVDMPYGSYESDLTTALDNARMLMEETRCQAVKCEGGREMAGTIKHLVQNGVPVMGHIGLLPQSVRVMGGYKIQGRGEEGAQKVIDDAKAIAESGAFATVIEGTVEHVSRKITDLIPIPTIGIGASLHCDGQILVTDDILGLSVKRPKFAKNFTDLSPLIAKAAERYAKDVREKRFPDQDHIYGS